MVCRQIRKQVILVIILLIILPIINAQISPIITSEPYFKQNTDTSIPLPCTIKGDYCSTNATCKTTIINPNNEILFNNYLMTRNGAVFEVNLSANQTETNGEYQFNVVCSDNGQSISRFLKFYITPNGEPPTTAKSFIYIGLLLLLFVLFILMIMGIFQVEYLPIKTAFFLFGYIILLGISFIAWNLSLDYLTSSPFTISIFRITFYVLLIALFPTILLSTIYTLYMMLKIDAIQKMLERGIPEDEAYERQVKGGLRGIR